MNHFDFGKAIQILKLGGSVAREGWNGKRIYLKLINPTEDSEVTQPFVAIVTTELITDNKYAPKGIVPWIAPQTDMLADDWYEVHFGKNGAKARVHAHPSKESKIKKEEPKKKPPIYVVNLDEYMDTHDFEDLFNDLLSGSIDISDHIGEKGDRGVTEKGDSLSPYWW